MIWAISPDRVERLRTYRDDDQVVIPLLVDADLAVADAFGVRNQEHPKVPHPTVAIVDLDSTVRYFHLDEDYKRRPPVADLLAALDAMIPAQ